MSELEKRNVMDINRVYAKIRVSQCKSKQLVDYLESQGLKYLSHDEPNGEIGFVLGNGVFGNIYTEECFDRCMHREITIEEAFQITNPIKLERWIK